jgi:hypothetical protein
MQTKLWLRLERDLRDASQRWWELKSIQVYTSVASEVQISNDGLIQGCMPRGYLAHWA